MKSLLLLTTVFLAASAAHAQDQDPIPLSASKVPLLADAPVLFVPRGWKIEHAVKGDLNRDKLPDTALVLVEDKPAKDKNGYATARQRALVVLLKTGKGWTRAGFNNSILLGTSDGGAFYGVMEAPVDVSIAKGILIVNEDNGSNEVTETTQKFRYDAARKAFLYIGLDIEDRDRASGENVSTSVNFVTGVKVVEKYRIDQDKGKITKSRVSRKLRTLESVKVDERYSE